jgi:hypothetical protein
MDRKAAARWPEDCGALCTRSLTTDLSMRRKVTLSARQTPIRSKTATRLDHRSIGIRPDANEVSTTVVMKLTERKGNCDKK